MPDASWISSEGIIAIVRGEYADHLVKLVDALYAGGIRILEVTMNSPDALQMIARLNEVYAARMWIGAGTVLTQQHVADAAQAGARFVVSPDTFPPVIERSLELGLESIPGAYTPSEIRAALRAGARFIKLFPAMPAGPAYLKQLHGPLPDVAFIPTGGVDQQHIAPFVAAGAAGFGLGSSLVPKVFRGTDSEMEQVKQTAVTFCKLLAQVKHKA